MSTTKAEDRARLLREWLESHPSAWSGWPTYSVFTAVETKDLRERLVRHQCPISDVAVVTTAIADVRTEKRRKYQRSVDKW